MSRSPKRELDRLVADLASRREVELLSKGVRFQAFASRRFDMAGLRYVLLLHVWPEDGFDNFEWDALHRSWLGKIK